MRVAVPGLFRDMWNDNLWELIGSLGPCSLCHGRAASSFACAMGPGASVLCCALGSCMCGSTCHGPWLRFPSLWLAPGGTFLSLFVNEKVSGSGTPRLPLSDWLQREQTVHPSIRSLWQYPRCFVFACSLPPGWSFHPHLWAFVFSSARAGKTGRAEKCSRSWEIAVVLAASRPVCVAHTALHGRRLLERCWEQGHALTNEWWRRFAELFTTKREWSLIVEDGRCFHFSFQVRPGKILYEEWASASSSAYFFPWHFFTHF